MMLNKENFEKNEIFQEYLEFEDLDLDYEPSYRTIFILEDGVAVNSMFMLGDRVTDHHAVLQEEGWDIERLITVEPETHTVILPIKPTSKQEESIKTLKNMWDDTNFMELKN